MSIEDNAKWLVLWHRLSTEDGWEVFSFLVRSQELQTRYTIAAKFGRRFSTIYPIVTAMAYFGLLNEMRLRKKNAIAYVVNEHGLQYYKALLGLKELSSSDPNNRQA